MNQVATETPVLAQSLATGGPMNERSWADFVARLKHDCRGEGVARHYTADAIFVVQAKRYIYGIDTDYGAELAICHEDSVYLSVKDFYESCLDDDERKSFDAKAQKEHDSNFLQLDEYDQRKMMEEVDGVTVTGRVERWDYVSAHFTQDAADAFIKRKGHDYRDGLRVYVEAQVYSWEYNTIKTAIMDGLLVLAKHESPSKSVEDLIAEDEIFTLIGHAEHLRSLGQADMPNYFFSLAAKLAGLSGNQSLKERVSELKNSSNQGCDTRP